MAILAVNPTGWSFQPEAPRKNRKRGHKLLRDKLDGLMNTSWRSSGRRADFARRLMVRSNKFSKLTREHARVAGVYRKRAMSPTANVGLKVKTKNVMSVRIPEFTLEMHGEVLNYGFAQTTGELDLHSKNCNVSCLC